MAPGDAEEMARLWVRTWRALQRSLGGEQRADDEAGLRRLAARFGHLLATDPDGSVVAASGGRLVGLAAGHVRGDTHVLANLCVAPEHQDGGLGQALLRRALAHGEDAARGLICSSPDPRALRCYVRAGFRLSPAMTAVGRSGHPDPALRPSLRPSDGGGADLATVDELDRRTRGVVRSADVAHLRAGGADLWVDDDGAYALVHGSDVVTVAGATATLAARSLAALLSGVVTGEPTTARWLTDATPWAFEAAADAGAECRGWGAVMLRGEWPAGRAYLPSGAFG